MSYVLGVDGGNTKTLALVAGHDGTIVAAGRAGCADIYNAASEEAALVEIQKASFAALADAGLEPEELDRAALTLAGADWPEDHAFLRSELERRLGLRTAPLVVNDALGGLWAGAPAGVGVAVVCGTAGAVGGRGRDGRQWHAGFWIGSSGGIELVRQAVRAVGRATVGIGSPTSLTTRLPAFFGEPTPEALLHRLTRRGSDTGWQELAGAAPAVLAAADDGDATAVDIVVACGAQLGDFAFVAAREAGLVDDGAFPLVLAGGVLRHPSALLTDAIADRVATTAPGAQPVRADLPPAAGSLFVALHAAGIATTAVAGQVRESLARLDALVPAGRR